MIQIYILPKFSLSGTRTQIIYLSRKRGKNFPLVFLSINHQASLVSYVWNSTYFIWARRILDERTKGTREIILSFMRYTPYKGEGERVTDDCYPKRGNVL